MTTINKEEIQKFSRLANEWWDVKGKFKPLHMFNPIRIEYITQMIRKNFKISDKEIPAIPPPTIIQSKIFINFFTSLNQWF